MAVRGSQHALPPSAQEGSPEGSGSQRLRARAAFLRNGDKGLGLSMALHPPHMPALSLPSPQAFRLEWERLKDVLGLETPLPHLLVCQFSSVWGLQRKTWEGGLWPGPGCALTSRSRKGRCPPSQAGAPSLPWGLGPKCGIRVLIFCAWIAAGVHGSGQPASSPFLFPHLPGCLLVIHRWYPQGGCPIPYSSLPSHLALGSVLREVSLIKSSAPEVQMPEALSLLCSPRDWWW